MASMIYILVIVLWRPVICVPFYKKLSTFTCCSGNQHIGCVTVQMHHRILEWTKAELQEVDRRT